MTNTYAPEPAAAPGTRPATVTHTQPHRPAFFRSATWRTFGYHGVSVLLAPLGFTYAVTAVSLGASLLVTVVGLVITAAMIVAARYWGTINRNLTASLLGRNIPAPVPFTSRPGFFGFLRSGLADSAGWRAVAHMGVSFVTSVLSFVLSFTFLATGLGCMSHWYWYQWLPEMQAADGSWHRGSMIAPDVFVEGFWWQAAYVAVGILFTFVLWPAVNNGLGKLQARVAAGLLGPTAAQLRVRDLETSRSASVNTADARLSQIERDLHDGTQAQLVAIAMKLGDARERLSAAESSPELQHLLDSAHGTAKDALTDLRSIARGIRPAVLNDGLDAALESLAASAALPVELDYRLPIRPAPAVEAIAYYCAAELVTNAVKHSRGTGIWIAVIEQENRLFLSVTDNGIGGANPAAGTGLAGLAERVRTVDGALHVSSPAGGPTAATVSLPLP